MIVALRKKVVLDFPNSHLKNLKVLLKKKISLKELLEFDYPNILLFPHTVRQKNFER